MKELSIEEKAKAYDEAIKVAKDIRNGEATYISNGTPVIDAIFPELKENEDEKIRKDLLYWLYSYKDGNEAFVPAGDVDVWITYLEKQGEQQDHSKFLDSIQIGDQVTKNEDGVWVNLSQLKRVAKTEDKVEQKPVDKVEPKFKIGDWVMLDRPVLITKVEDMPYNTHQYWTSDGTWFGDATNAKLWTIQDAKPGDVLVNQKGEMPFIFKSYKDCRAYCFCAYSNHKDVFFEKFLNRDNTDLHWMYLPHEEAFPATKEQRDLLFQKMMEAGYEWDAEKLELRKIEQKPAWSEEDEIHQLHAISLIEDIKDWANKDGMHSLCIERCIESIDWLKSLKDRVQPQPKWKPSEEHMHYLSWIANIKLGDGVVEQEVSKHLNELLEDLKKLREE